MTDLKTVSSATPLFEKVFQIDASGDDQQDLNVAELLQIVDNYSGTTHWFGGIDFFSDAELTQPAVPQSGTVEARVQTLVQDAFLPIQDGVLDATDSNTIFSFAINPRSVRIIITSIPLSLYCRVRISGNVT